MRIINFNEGTGTTVIDKSSNSNNGTMANMASDDWVSNSLFSQNYALDLDGSNDYVQIADDNALDISSSITISAWIYPTTIANKDGIISKRTSTENSGDWAFRFTSAAKLKLLIWDGDASNGSTSSTNAISTNTWTHIAFTHDNSSNTTKFYINGSLDATGTRLSKNLAGNNLMFSSDGMASKEINFLLVKLMKFVFGMMFVLKRRSKITCIQNLQETKVI